MMTDGCDRACDEVRAGSAGFTLIELLVAIALAALIGVLLVQSLRSARQGLAFGERQAAIERTLAAEAYLRRALLQAQPIWAGAGIGSQLSFDGNEESMSFVTSFATRGAYAGLYRVDLALEPNPVRPSLFDLVVRQRLFRESAAPGGQVPGVAETPSRLVENIAGAKFEYFTKSDGESEAAWLTGWQHPTQLPALVAVTVTFPSGDVRLWPRLTVPITAAAASTQACPPRVPCH